jgi:hypothetical protein
MSDSSNLAGLAVAIAALSLAWPQARKIFRSWTPLHWLKFVLSMLLCAAFALLPIPVINLLVSRNAAGQVPSSAVAGASLATFAWVVLVVIFLVRCLWRFDPNSFSSKPPKWLTHFGIADTVCLFLVALGIVMVLATRYG